MLSVIYKPCMLSDVMLNVVMLNVIAPFFLDVNLTPQSKLCLGYLRQPIGYLRQPNTYRIVSLHRNLRYIECS